MRKLIIGVVAALAMLGVPVAAGVATAAPAATCASASTGDSLYVTDYSNGTVERFDAATGCYQNQAVFVKSGSGDLVNPRGILHEGNLLVSNQNPAGQNVAGEINQYSHVDGKFLGAIVPYTDANAPFDPDGIIRGPDNRTLYVADLGDCGDPTCPDGRVATYDVNTGHFLGNLDFSSFISNYPKGDFAPRGLVFGPDGLLYVSVRSLTDPTLGWILSYNTSTGAVKVVASSSGSGCSTDLHRPDGLTFGPDGKLYVTSFRADSTDIDRILIFNAATGACTDEIDLDQAAQPRAFAQDILFGPGGYLFVPIAGGDASNAGAVRRYDVSTKTFTNFIAPEGPLVMPWGLTFGKTNPTTLAYASS